MFFSGNALSFYERAFRFSRLLGCSALLLLAAGCMQREPKADLVIVNGAEPESLDPAIITGQPDIRAVLAMFEGLTRYDPVTGNGVAGLADRWEITPDGRTYTFHLRSNTVWSTGEPINAQDVVYSWLRALNPLTAADYAGQLFFVENAEEYNIGKIKDPAAVGVHAIDSRTVEVRLKSPCPFFIDLCAFPTLAVVPHKWIEAHGDRWIMQHPVPVSGAYLLQHWRIHDKIRLRKNPLYWDAAHTLTETVDLLPIDSSTIAMNLYETAQADIIWDKNVIPMELMDVLRNRADCHVFPYLGNYFFRINVTKKPLDDVRVRKALALSIDKTRLVTRLCKAGEKPADHLTPDGTANYDPPAGVGYNPLEARRLLAAAGFPNGHGFPTLNYLFNSSKQNEQMAIELQEMWRKELGVHIELRQVEWKVYLSAQAILDYDLTRSSWIADYNDPNTFLDMWTSNNGNNRTGWKNPRYDTLLQEANHQTDLKKRATLLAQAETILIRDELPIVPIYYWVGINFFRTNQITGIYQNVVDEHPLSAIRKIELHPPRR
jgi:oligopeptide transport system substrate-binding protein